MTAKTYHIQFITPCFCAGADQSVAEVRAPSIRGKLRWWFRVVGGDFARETEVFGAVAGDEGHSSALVVRVHENALRKAWVPVVFSPVSNTGYVLYFAQASGQQERWVPTGALSAGSTFELHLLWRRNVSTTSRRLFDLALDSFLLLGSLGLRASRGLGSFECAELPFSVETLCKIEARIKERSPAFLSGLGIFAGPEADILNGLGAQLRGLRLGFSAGPPDRPNSTPLGSSRPRQTSAVYLRPVKKGAGDYRIVVFEAPAERVLGIESRRDAPRLKNGVPAPGEPPTARRGRFGAQRRWPA